MQLFFLLMIIATNLSEINDKYMIIFRVDSKKELSEDGTKEKWQHDKFQVQIKSRNLLN